MKVNELKELFDRIKRHFNTFGYDDAKVKEWHKFLKEYSVDDINDNLDKFLMENHDRPPLMSELIRGINKITAPEEKAVFIQCDLCKERILVGDDWDDFNKHYRRCQKIDFIDRQAKEMRGEGIDKEHFKNLSDTELDEKYSVWMKNWQDTHKDLDARNLFQRL